MEGYFTPLTATQIAKLFHAGRLRRADPCKETEKENWRTVDELFPLLKYDSTSGPPRLDNQRLDRTGAALEYSDPAGDEVRPMTSSLKAGWICFGLGLLCSWFFPLGNAFFSIAIIMAIVAMCSHQINRGLVLLLTSFFGIALSLLIFFTLIVGAIRAVAAPVVQRANANMRRMRDTQDQVLNQVSASTKQLQTTPSNIDPAVLSFPHAPAVSINPTLNSVGHLPPNPSSSWRSAQAIEQINRASAQKEVDRQTRAANVRQAELQRDRSNAKERQIEQLERSISWNEEQIRKIRSYGGDESYFVKQRDQLQTRKWDLQSR